MSFFKASQSISILRSEQWQVSAYLICWFCPIIVLVCYQEFKLVESSKMLKTGFYFIANAYLKNYWKKIFLKCCHFIFGKPHLSNKTWIREHCLFYRKGSTCQIENCLFQDFLVLLFVISLKKCEVVLDKQVVMAKQLDDFSGQVFVQNISFKSSGWVRFSLWWSSGYIFGCCLDSARRQFLL